MKERRHHNNKGFRQIQRGKTEKQVMLMAKRLGIPYAFTGGNDLEKKPSEDQGQKGLNYLSPPVRA